MYKEAFTKRIKEIRRLRGLSQAQVESFTKIDRTTLSRYESGQREPNIETLGALARLYEVSLDWLFGLEED